MGLLNQKTKIKVDKPVIRREVVVVDKPKPKPKPAPVNGLRVPSPAIRAGRSASPRASPGLHRQSASPRPPSSSSVGPEERTLKRKHPTSSAKAAAARKHRPSPAASDHVSFVQSDESEDDNEWERAFDGSKKQKRDGPEDVNRVLAHKALRAATLPEEKADGEMKFRKKATDGAKGEADEELGIIHAADLVSLKQKGVPMWGAKEDEVAVELQYPGMRRRERWVVKLQSRMPATLDLRPANIYIQ